MKSEPKLDVVFAIDESYIVHWCVALTSLLETNETRLGRIFVLHCFEGYPKDLEKAIAFFRKRYSKNVDFLKLDKASLHHARISQHVSLATYYRLFISALLPADIDEVLYLDSDLVVRNALPVSVITGISQSQFFAGAVDHGSRFCADGLRLEAAVGKTVRTYFNAGVLMLNLKAFRENALESQALIILREHAADLRYWDQDLLNILFADCWKPLPAGFNLFSERFEDPDTIFDIDPADVYIAHFTGSVKPWHMRCDHPFARDYNRFRRMTPFWPYLPENVSFRSIIGRLLSPYLRWLRRKRKR